MEKINFRLKLYQLSYPAKFFRIVIRYFHFRFPYSNLCYRLCECDVHLKDCNPNFNWSLCKTDDDCGIDGMCTRGGSPWDSPGQMYIIYFIIFAFRFYHPIFVTEDVNATKNLKNVRQGNCAKLKMIAD